jgi:uncharacterized membrane protein
VETLLRWVGFGLCHQLPERSFFGGGLQLPVCARDTGIFVGFVVGLAALALIDRGRRSSDAPPLFSSVVLVGMITVMALDGLSSYAGWRVTSNGLRLLTGVLAGFGLAAFTMPLVNGQLWIRAGAGRILPSLRDTGWYVGAAFLVAAVVHTGGPFFGVAYPVAVALAILVTFASVNLVIVCLLPPFERKASLLRDAWLPLGLACALGIAEIALSAWLKVWLLDLVRSVS